MANAIEAAYSFIMPAVPSIIVLRRRPCSFLGAAYHSKAMIRSSHRERKAKVTAEVLAMIAHAHPRVALRQPRPALETEEWPFKSATEFVHALGKYHAKSPQIRK